MTDLPEPIQVRVINYELGWIELSRVPSWLAHNCTRIYKIPERFCDIKPEDFDGQSPGRPPRRI